VGVEIRPQIAFKLILKDSIRKYQTQTMHHAENT
jgi:hypothetical protein